MIQATAALRPTSSTTGDNPYRYALSMPTLWPHTRCELDAKAGQVSHLKRLITHAEMAVGYRTRIRAYSRRLSRDIFSP